MGGGKPMNRLGGNRFPWESKLSEGEWGRLNPAGLYAQCLFALFNSGENRVSGLEAFCFRPKQFVGDCAAIVRIVQKSLQ
jgi:hypothetical protein